MLSRSAHLVSRRGIATRHLVALDRKLLGGPSSSLLGPQAAVGAASASVVSRTFWWSSKPTYSPAVVAPTESEQKQQEQDKKQAWAQALASRKESLPDARGIPVATSSWECVEKLDIATWDLARWTGDVPHTCGLALAVDPGCVLARCVHAVFLIAHAGAAPPHPELLAHLRANRQFLSRGRGGEREVVHAAAVEAWVSGRPRRAAAIWEAWLLRYPLDLLALRSCHDAYLSLGDGDSALSSIARVLPVWHTGLFGYGQVLSMHAMALCEAGQAATAEEVAETALSKDKRDAWAMHALAHVHDHGGRASEGASRLKHSREDWELLPHVGAATHLAGHFAKFYVERGNYKAALRIVDLHLMEPLAEKGVRAYSDMYKHLPSPEEDTPMGRVLRAAPPCALLDATGLLWRLELCGISPGFRWAHLAKAWDIVSPDTGPDESVLPALIAHRLTPLEAVHRSMAAIASAELRRGVEEMRAAHASANNDNEGTGLDVDSDVTATATAGGDNRGVFEAYSTAAATASSDAAAAATDTSTKTENIEATTNEHAPRSADGSALSVTSTENQLPAVLANPTAHWSVVVAADATETGVRGLDFSESVDSQLASQRQLDIWFAEAADKVADMVAAGVPPVPLEARFLPSALLPPPPPEDDPQDPSFAPLIIGRSRNSSNLALASSSASSSSSPSLDDSDSGSPNVKGDETHQSSPPPPPLLGIEHLFEDFESFHDDDDDEGGQGDAGEEKRRSRASYRPIAPAAPFCREPYGLVPGAREALAEEAALGMVAFWNRDLSACVDALLPHKSHFAVLGGSVLDQETVALTLIEAAVRSSAPASKSAPPEYNFASFFRDPDAPIDDEEDDEEASNDSEGVTARNRVSGLVLARALLAERTAIKTGSAQAWVRYAVVLDRLGNEEGARAARSNAHVLGLGQGGKGAN